MIWQTIRQQYQLLFKKGVNARNNDNRIPLEKEVKNPNVPPNRKRCCCSFPKKDKVTETTETTDEMG